MSSAEAPLRLGIVSDTHGLLRPELFRMLEGVDHILHAGDLGPVELLDELGALAPVTAVCGNTDGSEVRAELPEVATLELGGLRITVVHGHRLGSPTPVGVVNAHPGADLIVYGHSHRPVIERVGASLVVNPGSAGPRRFGLPVTAALADLENGSVSAHLVSLLD